MVAVFWKIAAASVEYKIWDAALDIQNPPVIPFEKVFGTPKCLLRFRGSNTSSKGFWMYRVVSYRENGGKTLGMEGPFNQPH